MKHVYRLEEPRDVDHAKRPTFVSDTDLPDAMSHRGHRLPVVWIATPLHEVKLETCSSSRGLREGPQSLKRIPEKFQFLQQYDHGVAYISIDISGKRGLLLQMVAGAPTSA
jgi:hypothetical protein